MSAYFDRLETELRAAVPRATETGPAISHSASRPRLRRLSSLTPWLAVAVTIAVAVAAFALLGHRSPGQHHVASPRPHAGVGTDPTAAQLLANFAALRRTDPSRPARALPGGVRIYLTLEPTGRMYEQANAGHLDRTSSLYGAWDQYDTIPHPEDLGKRALWLSAVPDGITRVRWEFACQPTGAKCARPSIAFILPVIDNIAAVRVPGSICAGRASEGCLRPVGARWYAGSRLARTFSASRSLTAPPFQHVSTPVIAGLTGDGILGARFGDRLDTVLNLLAPILGAPAARSSGPCGGPIDAHQVSWKASLRLASDLLLVFDRHDRLRAYAWGRQGTSVTQPGGTDLTSARGLAIGDTLARGHRLYGAFSTSPVQGGTWTARTPAGAIAGFATGRLRHGDVTPASRVATIQAGVRLCSALSP